MSLHAGTYVYEDRALGPAQPIVVETAPDVFVPTSTTRLLLRAARRHGGTPRSALDLGCGCGVVALALRRFVVPVGHVGASDVSAAAVGLALRNAARHGLDLDVRQGSLFEPWGDARFDLIVDDVAAMSEPLARSSPWYPDAVPSEAGVDGTRWIREVFEAAPRHLVPGGRLIFPLLSLAEQQGTLAAARARFETVRLLEEEWYPLPPELLARGDLLRELSQSGTIELKRRGTRTLWATRVYVAAAPRDGGG